MLGAQRGVDYLESLSCPSLVTEHTVSVRLSIGSGLSRFLGRLPLPVTSLLAVPFDSLAVPEQVRGQVCGENQASPLP